MVLRCVYTDSEVAAVGLVEKKAKEKGTVCKKGQFSFTGLGKSRIMDKTRCFVKVLTNENDYIICVDVTGFLATELLADLTLVVYLGLKSKTVGDVIHPHPAFNGALMEALHNVHKQVVYLLTRRAKYHGLARG